MDTSQERNDFYLPLSYTKLLLNRPKEVSQKVVCKRFMTDTWCDVHDTLSNGKFPEIGDNPFYFVHMFMFRVVIRTTC